MNANKIPDQNRRRFIRVAGGGIIAAAVPMTACTSISEVPKSAVAAWQLESLPQEYRRWIMAHAILAPNPHNRQPWLVDLSEPDTITVSLDTERLLPHTDPYGRQMMIGTGAMLGLLELAAIQQGYSATVSYAGNQAIDRLPGSEPLVRVEFTPLSQSPPPMQAALFEQIPNRHTERGNYNPARPVPTEFQENLPALLNGSSEGRIISVTDDAELFKMFSELVKRAWYTELATPATMMESMNLFRVGAAEINQHRDGIVIDSYFLVMLDKLGLFDRSKPISIESRAFRRQIEDFNTATDSTPAFYVQTSSDNTRMSQIEAGVSYVKTQLYAAKLGLTMHPLSQGLQEYPEVKSVYTQMHRLINGDNQSSGQTVQMLTRIGYPSTGTTLTGPSPRRDLQEFFNGDSF